MHHVLEHREGIPGVSQWGEWAVVTARENNHTPHTQVGVTDFQTANRVLDALQAREMNVVEFLVALRRSFNQRGPNYGVSQNRPHE